MRPKLLLASVALGACLAACSSSTSSAPAASRLVFSDSSATAFDGAASPLDVSSVCGSSTDTFLAELLHHPPTDLKVMKEWGDAAPGGRELLMSGTAATVHLGAGDLPIDHPLGDDLSMDVKLDPAFTGFSQKLGTARSDVKPGEMHVEISSGYIPHVVQPATASPTAAPTQTWQQLSEHNFGGGFQPGFDHPAVGDPVLVGGRYIVDCGHPDYHTELHPMSFLAWSHPEGSTTVVHFYENPYFDTELYSPDSSVMGTVDDNARLTNPTTQLFPPRFISEVGGVLSGSVQRLDAYELVGTMGLPQPSWQLCASGGSGGNLAVHYDVRSRPGVSVSVNPDSATGCASVQLAVAPTYASSNLPIRTCVMPWGYINKTTASDLGTTVNAEQVIQRYVPQTQWPVIGRDPLVGCADSLSGPTVSALPGHQVSYTDPAQPLAVYGVLSIRRS